MSDDTPQTNASENDAPENPKAARLLARLKGLRDWSSGNPLRSAAIGGVLVTMVLGTLAGWVYLSSVAANDEPASLVGAYAAWDARELEAARDEIRDMQHRSGFEDLMGEALFILGAIKTEEASKQWSPERQQIDYLVASRYLEESKAYGFVPERENEGLLLLGKSLVESHQFAPGISVLNKILEGKAAGNNLSSKTTAHRLLSKAHFHAPEPDLSAALTHNTAELEDATLTESERNSGQLLRVQILNRLGDFDEALATLNAIEKTEQTGAWRNLLIGQALIGNAAKAIQELPNPEKFSSEKLPSELVAQIDKAIEHLQTARSQDHLATEVTRRAMFLLGRGRHLQGDIDATLSQYIETRRVHGSWPEGLAAALFEAELHQRQGETEKSLAAYRRVLESVGKPQEYWNPVLPLAELRRRVGLGIEQLVQAQQFEGAVSLLERYRPLFDSMVEVEQRAHVLEIWGLALIDEVRHQGRRGDEQRHLGRRKLREAGVAYEQLAKLKYSTKEYPEVLWKSAENFFRGQSYTSTIRILDDYLRHEPERRNPQALLRLGQSHLALGNVDQCISALEECNDFHPHDDAVYQAHINAARAYRIQGNLATANDLLEDNLARSGLTPRSGDWRESLLELGTLMFELGQHKKAIRYLDQYVQRLELHIEQFGDGDINTPDNLAKLLPAKYLIAEAQRFAAVEPLEQMRAATTKGERIKSREAAYVHLKQAERHYNEVLTSIKRSGEGYQGHPVMQSMYRNCYMLLGSVLFDQQRYREAREAYQNVSALFANDPFVLETYVQISHCWHRLNEPEKARGTIQEAQFMLGQFPDDVDFLATTNFTREQWQRLVDEMIQW